MSDSNTPTVSSKVNAVHDFFQVPDRYLKKDFAIRVRSEGVRNLLGDVSGLRMVDLGCGDGSISLQFAQELAALTLVDLTAEMLERARANTPQAAQHKVAYVHSNLSEFQPSETFDVALCIGVLAHVDSISDAVQKVASLVRPGGRCIFQITDRSRPVGWLQHTQHTLMRRFRGAARYSLNSLTGKQVRSVAAAAGLELRGARHHSIILPGMGRLPDQWLYRYDRFALQHQAVGMLGADAILLFERTS
jgi:2-polyprenyl-3-methyl-5-hydroxy-6-metoxy-1,4-benzoquinol methylase